MYRADDDPQFAPVGETEFVNGIAAMSASGAYGPARVCAGIVGYADLQLGERVDAVLEAHLRAGGGRFRGVRGRSVWDADPSIKGSSRDFPPELLLDARFREGVSRLAKYGFSFDAWLFHPQIPELADLAAKFPDTTFILDHVGAPLAVGRHAGKRDEVFALWRRNLEELAQRPNVFVKLGGLAMHLFGFDLDSGPSRRAGSFRDASGALAALHAHLHRALWRGPLHVREQLPGRQTRRELSGAVERLQEDRHGRLRQREGGAVQRTQPAAPTG